MLEEGERSSIGFKISCIVIITIMATIGFASILPVVEESDGWEGYTSTRQYTSRYFGRVSLASYSTSTYSLSYNYQIAVGRSYSSTPNYYYYKGFMSFPVSNLDVDTYVNSGSVSFYVGRLYGSPSACDFTTRLYLMDVNPISSSAEDIYNGISPGGTYLGSYRITTTGTKTVQISSAGIDKINEKIQDGDNHLFIGFDYYDAFYNYEYFYMYANQVSNTINLNIDREAPVIDSISEPDEYINSTSLEVSTTAHDLPATPNLGVEEYQVGFFLDETTTEPYATQLWTDSSSSELIGLDDGEQYFIRTRARDTEDHTSDWSNCINTTIDLSPPSVPIIEPETEYSKGTSVTVNWSESVDAGIGVDMYEVQRSTDPTFAIYEQYFYAPGTTANTFDDLSDAETYYFRMRANDSFDQKSDFSPIVSTIMDDEAPSVPILMVEPVYTKGVENTFQWHPAVDNGVGLDHYQVQLSYSDSFEPGEILEDITTELTLSTFSGLNDGVTYYVRIRSVDEFDHMSDWSTMEWSIQDNTGPGEPGLLSLMEYQMDGGVQLEWEGSVDEGTGVGWYLVEWSQDMNFIENVEMKDHVLGQSMMIADLDPGVKWYFKVTPIDTLENPGLSETTSTKLDATPPELSIIDEMDEFTQGENISVSWSASIDDISGLDHYYLEVFSDHEATMRTFDIHTTNTEYNVPGLVDGMTYYYRVTVFDVAGNSLTSGMRFSTQDSSSPVIELSDGELFGGEDSTIGGSVFDQDSGIATVEVSLNGGDTWEESPFSTETWTYSMDNIPPGMTSILVRGTDNVGNIGEPTIVMIDNSIPIIEIISPETSSLINGPVQIIGVLEDAHMESYSIDYKLSGTEYWMPMVPMQSSLEFTGVLGTWLPMGLDDGDYLIKVTATDTLGQSSEIAFNLTLEQAELDLGSSSITFSDPKPTVGETVTVSVEVANDGDSDAKGVTIVIFDNGEEIEKEVGLDIPAGDSVIVDLELLVTGNHSITARAESDRYDTGEMAGGSRIVAIVPEPEEEPPEEGFLEDSAGILGLLALIIGILAIIAAVIIGVILPRRKTEAKEAEVKEPEGPAGMPAAPEKPALPPTTQAPIVPRPTLPPTSTPPPAAPATPPPAEPAPAQEPQFQAAPSEAPMPQAEPPAQPAPAPAPVQQTPQPATAPAPAQQPQVSLPQQ